MYKHEDQRQLSSAYSAYSASVHRKYLDGPDRVGVAPPIIGSCGAQLVSDAPRRFAEVETQYMLTSKYATKNKV